MQKDKGNEMTQETVRKVILEEGITRALEFAGLQRDTLSLGSHPDTGEQSWVLNGTIQQYSAFLIALAVQYRSASALEPIVDSVQIENRPDGDTLFWIRDLAVQA